MKKENKFTYTYSASETEKIKKIREKYAPEAKEKSVLEEICELDKKAEKPGTILSLFLGIIGTLLFGTGMACIMKWAENHFILGIIIGIAGIIIAGIAYPVFSYITKRQRKKIAPVILKLTDEIADK